MDEGEARPDAKAVTPIGRLVGEVQARHPDWTQAAIASRAGLERSVLNAYMHTPGRKMTRPVREKLAKAMRIEQWEIDEAAAEQAGYEIRRPTADLDSHKLLSRVADLPPEQCVRWHRLARALADTLAAESTDNRTGTAGHNIVPVEIDLPGVSAVGLVGRVAEMQEEIRQVIARNVADMQRQELEDQQQTAR